RPIEADRDPWPHRTEGVEPLGPRPLPLGTLDVAGGHVVEAGDARDRLRALGLGCTPEAPADDHGKLRLVMDLLRDGLRRQDDRLPVADQRAGRLHQKQRLLRHLAVELLGVIDVVLSDPDDLAGKTPGEELDAGELALSSDTAPAAQHRVQPRDLLDLIATDDAFEDFAVSSQIARNLNHVRSPSTSCRS